MPKARKNPATKLRRSAVKAEAEADPPASPRLSGLAAAAQVLRDAGEPLRVRFVVERMLSQNLWTSNGRTPNATIAAAMLRDIAAKGDKSAFRRAGRGLFAAQS